MVVAESRRAAEDALALIETRHRAAAGRHRSRRQASSRRAKGAARLSRQSRRPDRASTTATSKALSPRPRFASRIVSVCTKAAAIPIETRGIAVRLDPIDNSLTVYANTQAPHRAKQILVASLGLAGKPQMRVVQPDTGGGFGTKAMFHPEELGVPAAAMLLRCPLKWIEDRRENFIATVGERDQVWDMEMAFDADGRMLGAARPAVPRPRRCDALRRGAAVQRGDQCHRSLHAAGLSARHRLVPDQQVPGRADARRRAAAGHLCHGAPARRWRAEARPVARRDPPPQSDPAERMPYAMPVKQRDGDRWSTTAAIIPSASAARSRPPVGRLSRAAGRGASRGPLYRYRPRQLCRGTGRGPFESVGIRIGPSGRIVVTTGATAQGQGVKTMMAQIVAETLAVDPSHHSRGGRRHVRDAARPWRLRQPAGRDGRQRRPPGGGR